jgi:hypothetical protein
MKHSKTIEKYNGTTDQLVEDIGNLHYEALREFLEKLSLKIFNDSVKDNRSKKFKLSRSLELASDAIDLASTCIDDASVISKPYQD